MDDDQDPAQSRGPTRPRPPPQFSSNFTIAIFWVRVSQNNACQNHLLSIHLWEKKPRGKAKKKKKGWFLAGVRSQPSNYAVYATGNRSSWFLKKSRGLGSSTEYGWTPQNAESPNFDRLFLTNLRLGAPDYTGSPLQVSRHPQTIDFWILQTLLVPRARKRLLAKPWTLQTTCSCPLEQLGWGRKALFLLRWLIKQRPWMSKAKAWTAQSSFAARAVPWLLARSVCAVSLQSWKPFAWLKPPWMLRSFPLPLHGIAGCTQTVA